VIAVADLMINKYRNFSEIRIKGVPVAMLSKAPKEWILIHPESVFRLTPWGGDTGAWFKTRPAALKAAAELAEKMLENS
jgi:hypothetical protein